MDMLNFKHGLYANLFNADGSNKVEISNGTIYVTTDEKAMYVDLGGNRIRLSQIVNIPTTTDWQNLTPPYSKEAFYYIIEANALLKYTDSGWVQINSTTEIESILENMGFHSTAPASPVHGDIYTGTDGKNYIYDNTITEGQKWVEIGKVGAEILDLEKALASINTTVATHGQTIETLGTDLETAEADIDNLETIVGYKGKVDTLPTSDVTVGDIYRVGETYNVCTKITEGVPVWETTTNESARIEALKVEIAKVKEEAGTAEGVEALSQELTRVTGEVDTLKNSNFVKADGTVKMTGNLDVNSHKVVNVAAPKADTDATNKTYVDTEVGKATQAANAADTKAGNAATAAGTAQGRADAAYSLAEQAKNTADAAVTSGQLTEAIKNFATKTDVNNAKSAVLGQKDGTDFNGTVMGAYDAADQAQETAAGAQEAIDAILKDSTAKTIKAVEDRIKLIEDNYATDDDLKAKETAILGTVTDEETGTTSNFNGTVKGAYEAAASVDNKVTNHETRIAALEEDVEELNENLISKIQTADAMVYRGTVATEAELATKSAAIGGAHIGDTYKATAEFTMTNDTKVNIGDLLIASGTEDDNGIITTETLTWDHVPSGYVAHYNPELTVATAGTNSVEVELTSAHAADNEKGDLGNFQISAVEGSALTVQISEGSNIAIGMTWGSF